MTAVHAKPRHVLALLAIGGVLATAAPSVASTAPQRTAQPSWRVAWGTAVDAYVATSQWTAHPTQAGSPSANDATYRFVVRPTISGTAVRLRFANVTDLGLTVTGATPVTFDAVDVGLRQGSAGANIVRGTSRRVTFGGKSGVTVMPGGSVLSDPLKLNVPRLKDLAVSVYVPTPSNPPFHAQTYVTQYVTAARAGNHAADISGRAFTTVQEPIYWLDAVDVLTTAPRVIAAIGDSINDGDQCGTKDASGSCQYNDDFGMDKYPTYPDFLAERLAATRGMPQTAVINEGVDGTISLQTIHTLQHDVLDQPGVSDVIVEVGTNDITIGMPASQIIQNLTTIANTLHQHHVRVIGATLVPRGDYDVHNDIWNTTRAQVNQWIRTTALFDGVLDVAKTVGRPGDDNSYQPHYDSGDHLHPSTAGYKAIADGLNLAFLQRASRSTHS